MTNRRRFIQAGLALSAASLPALLAGASIRTTEAWVGSSAGTLLERFVFDARFAEAACSARHARQHGVPPAAIEADLMDLWYRDLDLRWKAAPMALAGVTTRGALFVLETLAADHGMRVICRGEHAAPRNGTVAHVLNGPAAVTTAAAADAGESFWAHLAWALTSRPLDARSPTAKTSVTTSAADGSARTEPLFSWIIAPRALGVPRV